MGGQRAGAVAGMNAGFLDVLHDAADEGVATVREAVDINLDGIGKIAVDKQRAVRRHDELGGLV